MMGERQVDQAKLFYEFSLERHVPSDHLLRAVDRFVDLDGCTSSDVLRQVGSGFSGEMASSGVDI